MTQRFHHTFGSIEGTNFCQYGGGVSSLPPPRFKPSLFFAQRYDGLQETFFSSERHQARPKLTQNGMIESHICQFEAQTLLPIEPTAHSIGSLPICEILQKLEDGDQRHTPWSISGLSTPWIQISKQFILVESPSCVTKPNGEIPLWKGRMHDADGL